ncbi:MAG: hypothetical protein ABIF82_06935 [Planctomycetota bacterium]
MRCWKCLAVLAFAASGCTRVVSIEVRMQPLITGLKGMNTVAVGTFEADAKTPRRLAAAAAAMLRLELKKSKWYTLAEAPARAQIVVAGKVACRIANGTVVRDAQTIKTRTAEVSVTFTGTAGKAMKLFTVIETPTVEDKRKMAEQFPETGQLETVLLRSCVRGFVADISPRTVRVKVRRPGIFGSARTRAGIDLLSKHPARAVEELAKALARDSEDAAALNALGFCSEVAGNLTLALSSYMYAAAIDSRDEYRENMRRVHDILEHKKRIESATTTPEGRPR